MLNIKCFGEPTLVIASSVTIIKVVQVHRMVWIIHGITNLHTQVPPGNIKQQ